MHRVSSRQSHLSFSHSHSSIDSFFLFLIQIDSHSTHSFIRFWHKFNRQHGQILIVSQEQPTLFRFDENENQNICVVVFLSVYDHHHYASHCASYLEIMCTCVYAWYVFKARSL